LKIIGSIKWLVTWISMSVLKHTLGARLKGEGASWLQVVSSNKPDLFNRVDFILDQCRKKKILHVGFTDYPYTEQKIKAGALLHLQLKKTAVSLVGLDVDENAIRQYITITNDEKVYSGDIMLGYPDEVKAFQPELILISEVLEHLKDPYQAMDVLFQSFPAGTQVLITVPNYTALDNLSASFNQTESIHPHHHWYFSPFTLRQLLEDKRFELNELHFGMYYEAGTKINFVLKRFPYNGDCIMGLFTIKKINNP
jgi:hypothetical protein